MKITELYIYPIKSLRPCPVARMRLGHEGPEHDRRFMLLRVDDAGAGRYTNVQVVAFPECALFEQEIDGDDYVVVTYRTPKGQVEGGIGEEAEPKGGGGGGGETKEKKKVLLPHRVVLSPEEQRRPALRVPLKPSTRDLRETVEVKLFGATATAYRMGEEPYDSWFSARLGYRVMLVYIGDSRRDVLAHSPNNTSRSSDSNNDAAPAKQGWLSYLASYVYDNSSAMSPPPKQRDRDTLTFNEAAPYLVTSRASLRDVSSRLPPGEEMNMINFRPNIVVDGDDDDDNHDHADGTSDDDDDYDRGYDGRGSDDGNDQHRRSRNTSLKPYEEDFWAELLVSGSGSGGRDDGPRLALTANCARCASINIDYETGRPAEGERGSVLKKLMKDRRVDAGNKWSPIFGRYAFLLPTPPAPAPASASTQDDEDDEDEDEDGGDVVADAEGAEAKAARAAADIAVGDEVRVTRRVGDRDVWSWPKTS